MDPLTAWLRENWFSLLQGIGIVGGLLFTALSIRRDTRARRLGELLSLYEHHREIWNEYRQRPELARALAPTVNFVEPINEQEREFINQVIVHFSVSFLAAREGGLVTLKALAADAQSFFKLPMLRRVWNETKDERDRSFVKFIEKSLK